MSQTISPSAAPAVSSASPIRPADHVSTGVIRALWNSAYSELKQVGFEYHEGELTLRGRLSSYYFKQMAQASVMEVAGVERVVNHIEVERPAGCPRS